MSARVLPIGPKLAEKAAAERRARVESDQQIALPLVRDDEPPRPVEELMGNAVAAAERAARAAAELRRWLEDRQLARRPSDVESTPR
jgi:hypothetical protein